MCSLKRIISVILIVLLLSCTFPVSAFASEVTPPVGMSVVAPAWWAYITALGTNYVSSSLTTSKLGDFLSDTINGFIGENTLSSLIGDGLTFDGGEFKLSVEVSNLFRNWLSRFISEKNISSSASTTVVTNLFPLTYGIPYVDNLSGASWQGSDYGFLSGRYAHAFYFLTRYHEIRKYDLTGMTRYIFQNGQYIEYDHQYVSGASFFRFYLSNWGHIYSSPPSNGIVDYVLYYSASGALIERVNGTDGTIYDYSYSGVRPSPELSVSLIDDFVLPDEYTAGQTISSPAFSDATVDTISDTVYESTVDNSFSARLEETVTRPIVDSIQSLWDGISDFFDSVGQWFLDFPFVLENAISNAVDKIIDFISNDHGIIGSIRDLVEGLSFSGIWHYVRDWFYSLSAFLTTVLSIWSNLPPAFPIIVYASIVISIIFGVLKRFLG